ncbi:MAG: MFS transporter [bacterium]
MINNSKNSGLFSVYLVGFLVALSVALMTYINSSFLSSFIDERFIGIIYIIASIFTIICFLIMPFILKKFGNYKVTLFLVVLELCALLGIAFFQTLPWLIAIFVINLTLIPLIYFSMDIFLEGLSSNRQTGVIRGIYLTAVNLAWIISASLGGCILTNNDYWKIYLFSYIFLSPVVLVLILSLRKFKDSPYEATHLWQTVKSVWGNKDVRYIFMAVFLLQFFYAWMVIYTPLYLLNYIDFSWIEIGKIFSIMLLPFVFIQFLAGKLADRYFGEKEMLSIGFIIMAISTMVMFFVTGKSLLVWSLILFTSRIGAAMVEVMCDVYFFKKVDNKNANMISFYRMASPTAYIIGPLLAILILHTPGFDIRSLFFILGFIMLFGLRYSLAIKDTK